MRARRWLLNLVMMSCLALLGCDRGDDDDTTAGDDDTMAGDDDTTAGDDDTTDDDDDSVTDDDATSDDDDSVTDDDDTTSGDDDSVTDDDDTTAGDDDTTALGGPDIEVLPTTLGYGDVYWGYPETLTLQVSNVGDADLTITAMGCTVPPISLAPFTGTIAPGDTEIVDVIANCTTELSYNGVLVIGSDDPDENPLQVQVFVACDEA